MIKLSSWNVRGLNALTKQKEVKEFLHCNGVHLCALLETHVHSGALGGICNRIFGRWGWGSNVAVSNRGARIVIGWDMALMDVMFLDLHSQFIHCQVQLKGDNVPFLCRFAMVDIIRLIAICYGPDYVNPGC